MIPELQDTLILKLAGKDQSEFPFSAALHSAILEKSEKKKDSDLKLRLCTEVIS